MTKLIARIDINTNQYIRTEGADGYVKFQFSLMNIHWPDLWKPHVANFGFQENSLDLY